jgi:hypothetical protein
VYTQELFASLLSEPLDTPRIVRLDEADVQWTIRRLYLCGSRFVELHGSELLETVANIDGDEKMQVQRLLELGCVICSSTEDNIRAWSGASKVVTKRIEGIKGLTI